MTPRDPPDHARVWAETIAATDYLAATSSPGYTVWDALSDAVAAWADAVINTDSSAGPEPMSWDDPDPLRTALQHLLEVTAPAGPNDTFRLDTMLTAALRAWLERTADHVNDGHRFATVLRWPRPPVALSSVNSDSGPLVRRK